MSGIPPTGVMLVIGGTTGLRVSDYERSVAFYNAIFQVLNVREHRDNRQGYTTWGSVLLIRPGDPPTQNSDVYLGASSASQLQAIVESLQGAGFDSLDVQEGSSTDPAKQWVEFLDPDGNRVWITYSSPQAS